MNALVLVNSLSPTCTEGRQAVIPYLDHLGVPYVVADLAHTPLTSAVSSYSLVIVAHRGIDPGGARLGQEGRHRLLAAVAAGTGLVSFDPHLPQPREIGAPRPGRDAVTAETLRFPPRRHYVTARHQPEEELGLVAPLRIPPLAAPAGGMLVSGGGRPLVAISRLGQGRVVRWATARWMHTSVLGPLAGLDDILWRGLVWAARKPFALRGLAPLVAMRVDDVAGRGRLWRQSPLYWVRAANRHGFKPWLGLFIYNLTPEALAELRELILRGEATAFPHAFGRPPRTSESDYNWYDGAIPWRRSDDDEFIYFDHQRGRAWSDVEAARGLAAVDGWYAAHAPLPMSQLAIPHWYELGGNVVAHIHDRWRAEFVSQPSEVGRPFTPGTPWLRLGPFRRFERPQDCFTGGTGSGARPAYYADWVNLGGRQLFDCLTEVRDLTGYEWGPDEDVPGTVSRGVRQLRRALDSMVLPVLFTHETDYIHDINPDHWSAEIEGVARGIAGYNPVYVTLDQAVRYVRATRTSRLESACCDRSGRAVWATFSGSADVATHFWLYTEAAGEIEERLVDVPPFEGEQVVVADVG